MLSENATHAHQKSLYIRPEQDKKQKKVAWYKKAADMLLFANSMIHSIWENQVVQIANLKIMYKTIFYVASLSHFFCSVWILSHTLLSLVDV